MLEEGDVAPDFDLPADGGERLKLKSFRGQPVVVYFYPRDDTAGCTLEAKDFTAHAADFEHLGALVIGISPDNPKCHDRFKTKHALTHRLASDEDTAVAQAYGVWVEKQMYGRRYMGVERATFLINPKGRIRKIWRKVSPKDHASQVLSVLKEAE